ncbi:hypothetical protein LG307_14325 [Sutcliffiella horikoshii]|uniref:hypothetical protein n=1 Tax=Sutcliffiella horikoshii TaxID=79883 RepID=UPI0038514BFB
MGGIHEQANNLNQLDVQINKSINGGIEMDLIILTAIVLIVFFSSSIIEKRLKTIEKQNNRVIEILEEIRDKK